VVRDKGAITTVQPFLDEFTLCAVFSSDGEKYMKMTMVFLLLLLNAMSAYANSTDEYSQTETHASLWVTFQTPERLPTSRTARKITAEALKNCNNWRIHAQKNFSAQISKLSECEQSNGICDSKGNCASYWAMEVKFNNPLTLVNRSRSFTGSKSEQSMQACLKWIRDVGKQEGVGFFWSTCSYEAQLEESEEVTGVVQSLPDRSPASKTRLLMHHQLQAQTPAVKFKQYTASSLQVGFPFKLQKSRADASDPEVKSSLSDCENWSARSLKKFAAQISGIDACKLTGSMCQASSPETCYFSHTARILWKRPRTLYSVEQKFSSPDTASRGFDACFRWLKDEQEFAPAETIDSQCSLNGYESGGGKTTYSIVGSFNQIELE
jgi:hypothetical protein